MSDPTPKPESSSSDLEKKPISVWRCLSGAAISGSLAYGLYLLTISIIQTFHTKPIDSDNTLAIRISIAVRTLVMGVASMATGIFALVTLGLIALAIQISIQNLKQRST